MKRVVKIYLEKPELAGVVLLIVLMAFFEVRSNGVFLSFQNIRGVLGLLPEVGAVTIGFAILMICGEFDLSVGSVFAIMPMSIALMLNAGVPFWPAFTVGVLICAVIGFLNGFITLRFDIPSFITTLGMLFMVRSLTVVISGGFPPLLAVDKMPMALFTGYIGGGLFRASFVWFVVLVLVASAVMSLTNFGNWIKATGGFLEAARSMGIPVRRSSSPAS